MLQIRGLQNIEISNVSDKSGIIEQSGVLLSHSVNIHCVAAYVMLKTSDDLRTAAILVGTEPCRLAGNAHKRSAAVRTMGHKLYRHRTLFTRRLVNSGYLGNDLPSLLHIEHVMLMDSKSLDNVFIMKRSPFHNRAGKQHRLKIGHRGYHPHATYFK